MITRNLVWRIAIGAWATIILVAHGIAPGTYQWQARTISHLGSQGYPNAWLMRTGFLLFGGLMALSLGAPSPTGGISSVQILGAGYGLAIAASGIWSAAPILPGIPVDGGQDLGHRVAANAAGVLLVLAMAASCARARTQAARALDLGAILLVTGLSLLFKLAQAGEVALPLGLVQRLVFLAGLGWLWLRAGGEG